MKQVLARRLSQALLPPRCLVCAAAGAAGRDLCGDCAAALPWNRPACARCGLPLPDPAPACGACLRRPPPFDACLAALRYQAPVDRLLTRLKYGGDLAAGALLSQLLQQALGAAPAKDGAGPGRPDALVPVPLHPQRLGSRGYNQSLELARPLARSLGVALCPSLLQRRRPTRAQTELDAAARRANVRGAFAASGRAPAHVALLDDTMTTGATLAECARALRAAGALRVELWVVARAP